MYFPDDFFSGEYRCDFFVPEMMKRAWAAEMELLELLTDICRRHSLTYFAAYGTMLGAVRHQGFIPWDDDIDIFLKRNDYNKLISILPKELPEGITLGGMYSPLKEIRDMTDCFQSLVTTIPSYWKLPDFLKRFHGFPYRGTSIDIFPLDAVPSDPETLGLQKTLTKVVISLLKDYDTLSADDAEKMLIHIEGLCNVAIPRGEGTKPYLYRLVDSLSSMYTEEECEFLTFYPYYSCFEQGLYRKEWFDEWLMLPFETFPIAVPKQYHEILTNIYGDYELPVKRPSSHDYPFYKEQENSLKNYLRSHGYYGSIEDFFKTHWVSLPMNR